MGKARNLTFQNSSSVLNFFIMTIFIPVFLNIFAYYGFTSNYTVNVFSKKTFMEQYENGIFKYRLIGKFLLLETYDALEWMKEKNISIPQAPWQEKTVKFLDEEGDTLFYQSYFILNTFFLCLTCFLLFSIVGMDIFDISKSEKNSWLMIATFLMVLSQFVVVPYDNISVFLLCSGIYVIILNMENKKRRYFLLSIIIIVSTLTRESSLIIVVFYASIFIYKKYIHESLESSWNPIFLFLLYLLTYGAQRLFQNRSDLFYQKFLLLLNMFEPGGLISFFFFLSMLWFFFSNTKSDENKKIISLFLILSFPYIFTIFCVGILWEIRLWVPIFICTGLLSIINPKKILEFQLPVFL